MKHIYRFSFIEKICNTNFILYIDSMNKELRKNLNIYSLMRKNYYYNIEKQNQTTKCYNYQIKSCLIETIPDFYSKSKSKKNTLNKVYLSTFIENNNYRFAHVFK